MIKAAIREETKVEVLRHCLCRRAFHLFKIVCFLLVLTNYAALGQPADRLEADLKREVVLTARRLHTALAEREEALDEQVNRLRKREDKAQRSLRKPTREELLYLIALYRVEKETLMDLRFTLGRERELVEAMLKTEEYGIGYLAKSRYTVSGIAHRNLRLKADLDQDDQASQERWEDRKRDGLTPSLLDQMQAERAAFKLAKEALEREWALMNYTLTVSGSLTLEEVLERDAAAAEQERERYRRNEQRLEESKKAMAGLIATLGAAVVLSNILDSTGLSPEQKKEEVKMINDFLRNHCIARGGNFFPGIGDFSIGHCSE